MKKNVFLLMLLSVFAFANAQPIEVDVYAGTDIWGDAVGFIGGLGGRYHFMEDKPLHFTVGGTAFYTYAQDELLQLSDLGLLATGSVDYSFLRLFGVRAQLGLGVGFPMPKGDTFIIQKVSFVTYPSVSVLFTPLPYMFSLSCAPKIAKINEQTNVSICVTLGFGMRFGKSNKTSSSAEPIADIHE